MDRSYKYADIHVRYIFDPWESIYKRNSRSIKFEQKTIHQVPCKDIPKTIESLLQEGLFYGMYIKDIIID